MKTKRCTSFKGKGATEVCAQLTAMGYIIPGAKIMVMRDQPVEQITEGGIIATLQQDEKIPQKGTIVGIGQGVLNDPSGYDVVGLELLMRSTFSKYGGHKENISLLDGDSVVVEFMHATDLYLIWVDNK